MRNMSFALTTAQILNRSKTVTRRLGWEFLKPGDHICAVRKGRGLKAEQIERLATLRIVDVRQERLTRMLEDAQYGLAECRLEGFDGSNDHLRWPLEFVEWFARTHGCSLTHLVTRIEFDYV
jgi:hypothetical protein